MNAGWYWAAIICLLIIGGFTAWLLGTITGDTIRAYRNDRRDARDVKRGAL